MKTIWGVIDIEKRSKIPLYAGSTIGEYYKKNQIVELAIEYTSNNDTVVKWYNEQTRYFVVPDDCYTEYPKSKYPEYYL